MTSEQYLKAAWQALLKGDTNERDRLCDLARDALNREEAARAFDTLNVILLPDYSDRTIN